MIRLVKRCVCSFGFVSCIVTTGASQEVKPARPNGLDGISVAKMSTPVDERKARVKELRDFSRFNYLQNLLNRDCLNGELHKKNLLSRWPDSCSLGNDDLPTIPRLFPDV